MQSVVGIDVSKGKSEGAGASSQKHPFWESHHETVTSLYVN